MQQECRWEATAGTMTYLGIPPNPASSLSVSQEQACAAALRTPAPVGAQMQVPAPSISLQHATAVQSEWQERAGCVGTYHSGEGQALGSGKMKYLVPVCQYLRTAFFPL